LPVRAVGRYYYQSEDRKENRMPERNQERERRFQLYGWLLFAVCSFFFIADSAAAGSAVGIIGSVIFLLACIVFLIPLVRRAK